MANEQALWMNRAALYELLSLGFLRPTKTTAQALVAGEFAGAASEVLAGLNAKEALQQTIAQCLISYVGRDAEEVYHEILRDYTRLFVGERESCVTPFAGVHAAQLKGQKGLLFVGKESMAIERFMRARGVAKDLSAGQSNDPVDHIGTVCEFLQFLCLVNAQAVVPAEGVTIAEDDFAIFWRDLWGDYPTWCTEQVATQAATSFYRAMAALLQASCENAAEIIAQLFSE